MALRVASRSGSGYPRWVSDPLTVDGGHGRALVPLLVLLFSVTIGDAFANVLVPLHLALEAVKDRSNRFFARGMADGDVEEFLGGLLALAS